jgi:hypothetical protein
VIHARTAIILLLAVPLVLSLIGAMAFHMDWSGPLSPPSKQIPLHQDWLRELHFTINGLDPAEQPLTLQSQERFLVDLHYTRDPAGGQTYDHIVMLLVYEDGSETGKIETEQFITFEVKYEEQQTRQGLLEWQSRPSRGKEGLVRWFNARPGTYELRLCWKREPKTVAEMKSQQEAPFRFLFPFYRATVSIDRKVGGLGGAGPLEVLQEPRQGTGRGNVNARPMNHAPDAMFALRSRASRAHGRSA